MTETSLGCEGRAVAPTSAASARSAALQLTKECSEYTGLAGSFCTITASSIKEIVVGTRVVYGQSAGATSVDSDVMLDMPGPGNNTAFGHCSADFATGLGLCTFSGGTGKFTWFTANADVSYAGGASYDWSGTYIFGPRD